MVSFLLCKIRNECDISRARVESPRFWTREGITMGGRSTGRYYRGFKLDIILPHKSGKEVVIKLTYNDDDHRKIEEAPEIHFDDDVKYSLEEFRENYSLLFNLLSIPKSVVEEYRKAVKRTGNQAY